jgi:hypothetical protein
MTRKLPFQCQGIELYSHVPIDSKLQFPESEEEQIEWDKKYSGRKSNYKKIDENRLSASKILYKTLK